MKSRNLCKKKWAQSRSISGRRCSLDWEQDFTQIGGLDPASHPPRFPGLFSAPRDSRPGGAPLSRLVRGWPLFPSVIKVRAGCRLPFRFFIHNRKRRIFAPGEAPSPSVFRRAARLLFRVPRERRRSARFFFIPSHFSEKDGLPASAAMGGQAALSAPARRTRGPSR